ncbi:MAG: hypothetical protein ACK2UR_14830 [Candidatus Promineifilaceae bacterium]
MTNDISLPRAGIPALVLFILLAALFAVVTAVPAAGASPVAFDCSFPSVNSKDCEALVELYESTNGDAWTDNSNWLSGSPCSETDPWFGVTCQGGRVEHLILSDNNLEGPLPASVLNMDRVVLLHLGMNRLSGAIPEVTIDDSTLTGLYLNQNAFEGEIPASLSKLANLEFLYLNGNILTGSVPQELCSLKPVTELVGSIKLDHNALLNDNISSGLCIDTSDTTWRSTQTVAPEPRLKNLEVATTTNDGEITVMWTPIDFEQGQGFYEVFMSRESGVYEEDATARTQNKTEDRVVIPNIEANVDYFFVVRTKSFANEFNPNVVTSDFSDEITNNPVAVSLAGFQAADQHIPPQVIIAAVLLLGVLSFFALAGPVRE